MNKKNKKCVLLLFLVILMIISHFIIPVLNTNSTISRFNRISTPPAVLGRSGEDYPYSGVGDWIIDTVTEVQDESITLNGNLLIQSGGNLTLDNVDLRMNCSRHGEYRIEVYSGGKLTINGNSMVTALGGYRRWYFKANSGSTISFENSAFSFAGWEFTPNYNHSGLWINTNEAKIVNCNMNNNHYGITLYSGNESLIANNTVTNSSWLGILLQGTSHNTLTGNTVSNSGTTGISIWDSSHNTLTGNTVTNNGPNAGISIHGNSGFNLLWGNILVENVVDNALDEGTGINQWDNDTHGNYWDDYTGSDTDSDGIGDTSYLIPGSAGAEDQFPLILSQPSAPQNLVGKAKPTFVELSWTASTSDGGASITKYQIYRSTTSGSGYTNIGSSLTTMFNDTPVSNGLTYYYVVRAVNIIGEGPASNEVNLTIPTTIPTAPQLLQAIAGDGFVELSWTMPTSDGGASITEYQIYRSTTSGSGYTHIGSSLITTFNDTTVSNGLTYYYVVRAVNIIGEGPASNEVTVIPIITISSSQTDTNPSLIVGFNGLVSICALFILAFSVRHKRWRKRG